MSLPPAPEPCFFETPAGPRYGCFQPGSSGHPPRPPVLIVGGVGHESVQFHRLLRQLSLLLASQGMASLRVDLVGTGDSPGEEGDWSLDAWLQDVQSARTELLRRTGAARCLAVGMRLGGTLVLQAGAAGPTFAGVALFDPVQDGKSHLAELDGAHQAMLQFAHVLPDPADAGTEILGFPQPAEFRRQLAGLDACQLEVAPAPKALLVQTHPQQPTDGLARHLEGLGVAVQRAQELQPTLWEWIEDFGRVHVPRATLEHIRNWCQEQAP